MLFKLYLFSIQWRGGIIEDEQLNLMILYWVEFTWKSVWFLKNIKHFEMDFH